MNNYRQFTLLPFQHNSSKIILVIFLLVTPIAAQIQFQKHSVGGGELADNGIFFARATDLDGDGYVDVISASREDNKIAWHENDGDENFTSHIITTNAEGVCAVCIVDLDGDGDIDILSGSSANNEISWYENDGTQNFTPHAVADYSEVANSIFAEDVDNDGDIDIISTTHSFDYRIIAWYENDGTQNFTRHVVVYEIHDNGPIFESDLAICIGDLNNDGNIDIISIGEDNKVIWYENDGNKIFSSQIIGETCSGAKSVSADDFNNDGYLDVFTNCEEDITFYENDGNEYFTSRTFSDTAYFTYCTSVISTDLDGDGNVDLVLADNSTGKMILYKNDSNNNFNRPTIIDSLWNVHSIYTTDLNGDGIIDVLSAASYWDDDKLMWHKNDGNESFDSYIISTSVGDYNKVISADLDNDGDMDVLSASTYNYHGMVDYGSFPPRHGKIFWFEKDFSNKYKYHIIDSFDEAAIAVDIADIDNDGYLDVIGAFSSNFNSKISWYKSNGEEDFIEFLIVDSIAAISSIFPVDIDGDWDVDILCAVAGGWDSSPSKIIWYENISNGEFNYHFITDSLWNVKSVFAIDLDSDGDTDILSASYNDNKIVWHENDSFENFKPHIISSEAKGAESVLAIDLDDDGDIDVISGSNEDNEIAWYENNGTEIFIEHIVSTNVSEISSLNIFDLDGDGYLDLIPSPGLPHEYTWYKNDGHYNFEAIIEKTMLDLMSVYPTDMDNDGDCDLLTAGNEIGYGFINYYENIDTTSVSIIKPEKSISPKNYNLFQNYPNPFNPSTTIKYSIPAGSWQSVVSSSRPGNSQSTNHSINQSNSNLVSVHLNVYNILGKEVATLVNEQQRAGNYEVKFDASALTSGVYFYKLTAGTFSETKKCLLLK